MYTTPQKLDKKRCEYCRTQYDDRFSKWPLICGHLICRNCVITHNRVCICGYSARECLVVFDQMSRSLEAEKKEKETAEKKLNEYVEKINELQAQLEREKSVNEKQKANDVTCSHCGIIEKEDRINICTTCAMKNQNVDVKKGEKAAGQDGFDINELALCAACVLKDHVGEDHKIVQFYPVLAATEADKYLSTFMGFRQKMGDMKSDLNSSKNELFANLETIDGKFQNMFDMVKRSKSSEATKQLMDVVANRYEKIQTTNGVIKASLEAYAAESNENIKYFTEENKKLDEELCLKEIGKNDWELNISKMTIEGKEDEAEYDKPELSEINQ